ncbi:glycosyltransferase family 4 protein [Geomonas sp. RF6]|uniref:glycosyltransferase family 4 protein n=1 Tax=Geomonas sp. RF6 TaxID=2897342 RepID=UPI001E358FFD|nr:glycosyltransferase family 4 protein [Geomonas sp. RF6]UFS68642.1 glycosyltransferase family 4 protein [Geomonas sp. RF6]
MTKLLMLYQDPRLPSSRVRVLNLAAELASHGFQVENAAYPRTAKERARLFTTLPQYDVVFLQKKLLRSWEFALLRHLSRKLVFDFDDAIYMRDDSHADPISRTRERRFNRTVRHADLVVAGNPTLAAVASHFGRRVAVVPSAVPVAGVPVKEWGGTGHPRVIGWVGGGGNLHHLAMISPALQEVASEFDLELRVLSNREFAIEGVTVRNVPWSLETQEAEIAKFDIGVMPMPMNRWTEGKCSYKLLQYMAAGVPAVATDWGFNRSVIAHGSNGFLAANGEAFAGPLRRLLQDAALCTGIGGRGRLLVEREFSLQAVGEKLAAALREIL